MGVLGSTTNMGQPLNGQAEQYEITDAYIVASIPQWPGGTLDIVRSTIEFGHQLNGEDRQFYRRRVDRLRAGVLAHDYAVRHSAPPGPLVGGTSTHAECMGLCSLKHFYHPCP